MTEQRALIGDHPRIRGEHLDHRHSPGAGAGSSPHTRGAHKSRGRGGGPLRIIPAYAGSTQTSHGLRSGVRDHPRIRGEHPCGRPVRAGLLGSSPHTRGAQRRSKRPISGTRIIPAYAGSTLEVARELNTRADHPRIRGEHGIMGTIGVMGSGSSPHTRGARPRPVGRRRRARIIPAYAGSTRRRPARSAATPDHPRIRGEHLYEVYCYREIGGSSPHTRGARSPYSSTCGPPRIIPAYAGSTSGSGSLPDAPSDHPRIRGEHFHSEISAA